MMRSAPSSRAASTPINHTAPPPTTATVLTTRVVERTQGAEAWYMHCAQDLTWYLTMWGLSFDTAVEWTELILEGSVESWIVPEDSAVQEVARQVAAAPWEKQGRT